MKKIMFNDKYGLTKAVLEGRKTMTRRIIPPIVIDWNRRGKVTLPVSSFKGETLFMDASAILDRDFEYVAPRQYQPKFEVGEVVAVAQAYDDIVSTELYADELLVDKMHLEDTPGWSNKMFVCADLMPHQIRITNVRLERLQDISDEDCLLEGVERIDNDDELIYKAFDTEGGFVYSTTPRGAFIALIDKVCDNGTWALNPWVFVYEFELVK